MGAECVRGQAEPLGYLIGLHAPRQTVQNLLLPRGQCGQGMIKTRGGLLRGYQFRQDVSEQTGRYPSLTFERATDNQ